MGGSSLASGLNRARFRLVFGSLQSLTLPFARIVIKPQADSPTFGVPTLSTPLGSDSILGSVFRAGWGVKDLKGCRDHEPRDWIQRCRVLQSTTRSGVEFATLPFTSAPNRAWRISSPKVLVFRILAYLLRKPKSLYLAWSTTLVYRAS